MISFGQSFGKFLKQGLRRMLDEGDEAPGQVASWLRQLPRISTVAEVELKQIISSPDFRQVDQGMW